MKGLSFTAPKVKAWLECRKTVTRRLMKPQPLERSEYGGMNIYGQAIFYPPDDLEDTDDSCLRKPKYIPGETVYIRETWCPQINIFGQESQERFPFYKTDSPELPIYHKWKSSRFMPEWASRSHALIISVRPEQIQSITPEEVKKEGLVVQDFAGVGVLALLGLTPETYMEQVAMMEFRALWESLHPGSWEKNEWCWVYTLKKLDK